MLNDAENVEQQHQAKAPPRSQQPPVSSKSSRSLLAEELYAMEAENYRLQRELVKIEQNNNSGCKLYHEEDFVLHNILYCYIRNMYNRDKIRKLAAIT